MAFPTSYRSLILPELISFLETESAVAADPGLEGAITWDFNSDVHLPSMNPRGLAYYVASDTVETTLRGIPHEKVRIRLRLLVSKAVDPAVRDAATTNDDLIALDEALRREIEDELLNAEDFLKAALFKVRTKSAIRVTLGTKTRTALSGHTIAPNPQRIVTVMDRQGRATGALLMDILWNDAGLFGSQYSHS